MAGMKITSRPGLDEDDDTMGTGPHLLRLTDEQLTLIAALTAHCRMTRSTYSMAAADIMGAIEEKHGLGVISDACNIVDLHATIDDAVGVVISTKSGNYELTLEV